MLAESFRDHNPACPFFVLIMGRVDGYFDPSQEPFFVVESDYVPRLQEAHATIYHLLVEAVG